MWAPRVCSCGWDTAPSPGRQMLQHAVSRAPRSTRADHIRQIWRRPSGAAGRQREKAGGAPQQVPQVAAGELAERALLRRHRPLQLQAVALALGDDPQDAPRLLRRDYVPCARMAGGTAVTPSPSLVFSCLCTPASAPARRQLSDAPPANSSAASTAKAHVGAGRAQHVTMPSRGDSTASKPRAALLPGPDCDVGKGTWRSTAGKAVCTGECGRRQVGVGHGAKLGTHERLQLLDGLPRDHRAAHEVRRVVPRIEGAHLLMRP